MVNLAPIEKGTWYVDNPWGTAPSLNVSLDTEITHNGSPTWKVEPLSTTDNTAVDFWGPNVNPGDTIVMSCWIKTAGTTPTAYAGARMCFDYYDTSDKRIAGSNCLNDAITGDYTTHTDLQIDQTYVKWGSDWTYVEWSFTVPDKVVYDDGSNKYSIPGRIVPWLQIWTSLTQYPSGAYTAWFSDFQLTKNEVKNMGKITFNGSVSAQAALGEIVSVSVTKPDGTKDVFNATTDANKAFTVSKDYVAGNYSVIVSVPADTIYKAATSGSVSFNVGLVDRTIQVTVQ
jgi:hypothetical protein